MDGNTFVPFMLQTPAHVGMIDHLEIWKKVIELHASVWNVTGEESLWSLLSANKVTEEPGAPAIFSLYPMHRGHSPVLRDWSKEQGMDLEKLIKEVPTAVRTE
ncbi:MAG: hypothetical protein A2942_00070 [Candidatus Lloydbacteria bacterium RIFCSPLOWO2_01_FULL_50_20]|uniref:Uncharacterized protein n=1 Tax=Candidatus Lloydbacteria bacterium RIFCSPLOWO2_01_FULL_50_20 TaxID=1798665 RepID=A0A1G2DEM5_9BACT|nr:MAG: hypothetical protein A3C13_04060 [Candidatus Lloydbacteria bacterium RIFCSPHIGHO2_02_FULL_50_11]OGZ12059.1 MAG: hypothetical protein A2942_00070 [Candidatus Lloydbacteria bacterium RIFCSPLOWO2_01_FULL_50_20]